MLTEEIEQRKNEQNKQEQNMPLLIRSLNYVAVLTQEIEKGKNNEKKKERKEKKVWAEYITLKERKNIYVSLKPSIQLSRGAIVRDWKRKWQKEEKKETKRKAEQNMSLLSLL